MPVGHTPRVSAIADAIRLDRQDFFDDVLCVDFVEFFVNFIKNASVYA